MQKFVHRKHVSFSLEDNIKLNVCKYHDDLIIYIYVFDPFLYFLKIIQKIQIHGNRVLLDFPPTVFFSLETIPS